MKKWVVFSGLKTVELCGFLLVMLGLTRLGELISPGEPWFILWIPGLVVFVVLPIAILILVTIICIVIWEIIKKNIEWAEKLSR